MPADTVGAWVDAVVARHTASFSRPEFLKAIRALSARYVERRSAIARRDPVDSAGKRAAFAAFYAPLHLLTTRAIVRALGDDLAPAATIADLGCGTGAAAAGWALARERPAAILGIDRHVWSLQEAAWNWRTLGLDGRTRRDDLVRASSNLARATSDGPRAVVAAWSVNELAPDARRALLPSLLALGDRGRAVLVIEPLARSAVPWWDEWAAAWRGRGGRADEWRFDEPLPATLAELSQAAGFRRETLGGRSLLLAGAR